MSNSLAAVHPELIAEWSDRNLPLTPDSVTFGSNKKVWWKGACGHEWETSIKARSSGEKCPICSGARVVAGINDLSTLKPELASEWSEENEIKPTEVSIGSHKKVIWKCKLGHEWIATVKSRTINRTGCPYCSHNKVLAGFNDLATLFPEVANEWSDKNEKKPTEVMAFANSKAWWKCRTCGYEWNTLISTRSGGSKCPCCSGYTFIKGKNDLKSTHPQIAEEWSEKNFPLKPNEVNAKSRKNVWWHCRKCGNEWKSVINARVKGTVCPVCAEREVLAVMVGTGLRVGELTGLRWCDIDLEESIIDVNHTLVYYDHRTEGSKKGCYFNVNTTKTPAGMRQVPMLEFVKEAFLMEKERQELLGLHCEATVDGYTDFIFVNRFGQPQHQATLNKAIRRIIRNCNDKQFLESENPEVLLPHFSCHSLRHTFTTRMCEAGVNVKVIQDALGHKDVSTTLNIYTDVTKELRKSEFEGLELQFNQ